MFLNFVGVNEKIVNLNAIALIEDESTETESVAVLTTLDGIEIKLDGPDAEAVFARAQLMIEATNKAMEQFSQINEPQ
jgi:hypothetical protein